MGGNGGGIHGGYSGSIKMWWGGILCWEGQSSRVRCCVDQRYSKYDHPVFDSGIV